MCGKHAGLIKKIDGHIGLSFASNDAAKSEAFKQKFKGINSFGNYRDFLSNDAVDTVFITTPPDSHYDLIHTSLMANKHVIVEKPVCFSSTEFKKLDDLSKEKKLHLLVAENYFYKPLRYKIHQLLHENAVGKPIYVNINATKKQENKGWRNEVKTMKYGALFEGGVHWINFINNIGLNIKNVFGFKHDKENPLEQSFQVTCSTDRGTSINLFYSWEIPRLINGLGLSKIYGTEGSITFESNGLFVLVKGKKKALYFPGLANVTGFKPMLQDFIATIKGHKEVELKNEYIYQELIIIEKAYHSSNNN
jgi:UDP-N-acetylglucosamine 3-dehydrogenase